MPQASRKRFGKQWQVVDVNVTAVAASVALASAEPADAAAPPAESAEVGAFQRIFETA